MKITKNCINPLKLVTKNIVWKFFHRRRNRTWFVHSVKKRLLVRGKMLVRWEGEAFRIVSRLGKKRMCTSGNYRSKRRDINEI